jgi:hypothetical protein
LGGGGPTILGSGNLSNPCGGCALIGGGLLGGISPPPRERGKSMLSDGMSGLQEDCKGLSGRTGKPTGESVFLGGAGLTRTPPGREIGGPLTGVLPGFWSAFGGCVAMLISGTGEACCIALLYDDFWDSLLLNLDSGSFLTSTFISI